MKYFVNGLIRKQIEESKIFDAIQDNLINDAQGNIQEHALFLKGFNKGLGGINCRVQVRFTTRIRNEKTSVTAEVNQSPTLIFWILIFIGLISAGVSALVAIAMYYYGKNQTISTIDRCFNFVSNELS